MWQLAAMAGFDVAKATEASDQRGRAAAALTDAIIAQRRQPGSQITPPVAAPAQVRPFSDPGPVRAYPHAQVEAAAGGADENLQDLPAARRVSLPGGIGCLAAMLTDEETHPAVVPHGHGERLPDEFLHLSAWLLGSQCLLATTHDAQRADLAGSRPRRQLLPPPVRVDMHARALGQKMAALALARPLAG